MRLGAARAVLLAGALGIVASGALFAWVPGGAGPAPAAAQVPGETTTTEQEEETTTTEGTTTTTTEASPVPTTPQTTTTTAAASTTTAAPTTTTQPPEPEPTPETEPLPPPPDSTTTTQPPPPPPPEDRTPPRQPGQAPVPLDDPQSQAISAGGAEIHAAFPFLSVGGFAVLGGLLGAQWYLTNPDRRGRRTL